MGCRLRISVEGVVDNLAAGNIAAFINPETGVITGNGVYSDITKNEVEFHPITGVRISGFQIPYWKETIALVKEIACVDFGSRWNRYSLGSCLRRRRRCVACYYERRQNTENDKIGERWKKIFIWISWIEEVSSQLP